VLRFCGSSNRWRTLGLTNYFSVATPMYVYLVFTLIWLMFFFGNHLVETSFVVLDVSGIDYPVFLHLFVIARCAKF